MTNNGIGPWLQEARATSQLLLEISGEIIDRDQIQIEACSWRLPYCLLDGYGYALASGIGFGKYCVLVNRGRRLCLRARISYGGSMHYSGSAVAVPCVSPIATCSLLPNMTNPYVLNALRGSLSVEGVRVAASSEDLDRIGLHCYSVYVDELGKTLASANQPTKQIRDLHGTSALHLFTGEMAGVQLMFCTTFRDVVQMYERLGMQAYRGMHSEPDFGPHDVACRIDESERRSSSATTQESVKRSKPCLPETLC